jgi:hypothetical protein
VLCLALVATAAACGDESDTSAEAPRAGTTQAATGQFSLPTPPPQTGRPIRGIRCDQQEFSTSHVHGSLQIVIDGGSVPVPADIGIDQTRQCLYWLHTHADRGVMHVEAPVEKTFTLADFFAVWGQELSRDSLLGKATEVRAWVDGQPYDGDPTDIEIIDRRSIVLADAPVDLATLPPPDFSEIEGS